MRTSLALLMALSACASEPTEPEMSGQFCESESRAEKADLYWGDLLVVIDDTESMAPYVASLGDNLEALGDALVGYAPGQRSYRVAIVSADPAAAGALQTSPTSCGFEPTAVLHFDPWPWWKCDDSSGGRCAETNFSGPLGGALACTGQLGEPRQGNAALLENARRAIERTQTEQPDFPRQHTPLAVVFIAGGDDTSPGELEEYLQFFSELPEDTVVIVIGDEASSPRLFAVADTNRYGTTYPIDGDHWAEALAPLFPRIDPSDERCIDASEMSDLDGPMPGLQPDCSVTLHDRWDDRNSVSLPACIMAAADQPAADSQLPCWWLEPRDSEPDCTHILRVEGHISPAQVGHARCAQLCE